MLGIIGCSSNTIDLPLATATPDLTVMETPEGMATPNIAEDAQTISIPDKTEIPDKTKVPDKTVAPKKTAQANSVTKTPEVTKIAETPKSGVQVEKGKRYSTKEEVALYIHLYNELPPNYITKKEAEKRGWDSSKGNLWEVTDKMSIGGDVFGNREGILPKKSGRKYYECDINYNGGYRGSERIVYSNDGLVYYTKDHYKTFEQLF